ncbi:hypothetical protein ATANTOWER_022696, partial [Ataeniobius toweri]|nr:hypothetical protein [Ataeniobius toweri]
MNQGSSQQAHGYSGGAAEIDRRHSKSVEEVVTAELEFVQIVIIIVVMTVMVVVIICLLNHYKLSTWSFITRQSQARRQDHALQQ